MNPKNSKNSPIHENADANITCDFGDGDISRSSSFLSNTCTTGANGRRTTEDGTTTEDSHVDFLNLIVDIVQEASMTKNKHCDCAPLLIYSIHILSRFDYERIKHDIFIVLL